MTALREGIVSMLIRQADDAPKTSENFVSSMSPIIELRLVRMLRFSSDGYCALQEQPRKLAQLIGTRRNIVDVAT